MKKWKISPKISHWIPPRKYFFIEPLYNKTDSAIKRQLLHRILASIVISISWILTIILIIFSFLETIFSVFNSTFFFQKSVDHYFISERNIYIHISATEKLSCPRYFINGKENMKMCSWVNCGPLVTNASIIYTHDDAFKWNNT